MTRRLTASSATRQQNDFQERHYLETDAGGGLCVKGLIGPSSEGDNQWVILNRDLVDSDRRPGAVQQQKRHTFTGFVGDRGNSLDVRVAVGADIESILPPDFSAEMLTTESKLAAGKSAASTIISIKTDWSCGTLPISQRNRRISA
jgi:hypothetical protein